MSIVAQANKLSVSTRSGEAGYIPKPAVAKANDNDQLLTASLFEFFPGFLSFVFRIQGNRALESGELISKEVGYRTQVSDVTRKTNEWKRHRGYAGKEWHVPQLDLTA